MRSRVLMTGMALALVSLGACAVYTEIPPPQRAYDDKSVPDAETAVVMKDPEPDGTLVTIRSVNGRKMSCWLQGCPPWVRLLPGTATIELGVFHAQGLSNVYTDTGDINVAVDAQAGHTYLIVYRMDTESRRFKAAIVDAGVGYKGGFKVRGRSFSPTFE